MKVWKTDVQSPATYVQFLDSLFISYTLQAEPRVYLGNFNYDASASTVTVGYAVAAPNEAPYSTGVDMVFDVVASDPGPGFTFTPRIDSPPTTVFNQQMPDTSLEGVWVSDNAANGCTGTVQFTGNLYRSYLTNCPDKTKTYVSLGIASVSAGNDMLDITFTYNSDGRIQPTADKTIAFNMTMSSDGNQITLSNTPKNMMYTYSKVVAPPQSVVVSVTLSGDLASFDRANFVSQLATALSIQPSSISIVSVTAGSVVVDMAVTSSSSVVTDIRDLGGSFGSYTVVSVSDQTPSSSPSTSSSPALSLSPLSFSPLLLLLLSLSLLLLA